MGSQGRRAVRRPPGEFVCPTCGQPVGTVIKRHKTLGAFVPVWEPGPCRNPACPEYAEKQGEEEGKESVERPGDEPGTQAGSD